MKIGILDIQGSVAEHLFALKKIKNVEPVLVKTKKDLDQVKGLIMPGGESTTIGKLLRRFGLREEIIKRAKAGMPVWGTCAGAILLAKKIVGTQTADGLELMDIAVERNAYGRQVNSFETQIEFDGKVVPAIFIRAPKIVAVGKKVQILAKYEGEIVAAREGNLMASSFHPELTDSKKIHEYFVKMCK